MCLAPVTLESDDAPFVVKQLLQQQQPLIHELQVVVIRPDVRVLDLLAEGVGLAFELGGAGEAAERHLADVVGAGVEGRVDVDEVHLAAVAVGEEVGEDFLVVAVEQETLGDFRLAIADCGLRRGEALDELGGEGGDVAQRALADPGEHRAAFGGLDGDGLLTGHVSLSSHASWSAYTGTSTVRSGFAREVSAASMLRAALRPTYCSPHRSHTFAGTPSKTPRSPPRQ